MTGPVKTYVVGGAVRDALLGFPVKDRDYVVVGATPDQMRAQGFLPVGKDFPVFLHPDTHRNMRSRAPNVKPHPAIPVSVFMHRPMSRWNRICYGVI